MKNNYPCQKWQGCGKDWRGGKVLEQACILFLEADDYTYTVDEIANKRESIVKVFCLNKYAEDC